MTLPAVHASLTHLVNGQDRNRTAILDALDAVASAHLHGGKDAFDSRMVDARAAVANAFDTMTAIHETARLAAGMPHEPAQIAVQTRGEDQSAEDTTARAKARTTRTSVPHGE